MLLGQSLVPMFRTGGEAEPCVTSRAVTCSGGERARASERESERQREKDARERGDMDTTGYDPLGCEAEPASMHPVVSPTPDTKF